MKRRSIPVWFFILLVALVTTGCENDVSGDTVTEAITPSPIVGTEEVTAITPPVATTEVTATTPPVVTAEVTATTLPVATNQPETTEIKSDDVSGMNGIYVSERCKFLTGFSSTLQSNDSGYQYQIDGTSFRVLTHAGKVVSSIEDIEWDWKGFPYTDEEWEALCSTGLSNYEVTNLSNRYQERLYQALSEQMCLLKMDDELWLVDVRDFGVWSVYTIVPEDSTNSASWIFTDTGQKDTGREVSLPIRFDMEYTKLKLSTTDATLMLYNEEAGLDAYGLIIPVPEGATIYWNPYKINSSDITKSESLHFLITMDGRQYNGKINIEGNEMVGTSDIRYTIKIIGEDFVLKPSETECVVVIKKD